jgi:hypothetical protein
MCILAAARTGMDRNERCIIAGAGQQKATWYFAYSYPTFPAFSRTRCPSCHLRRAHVLSPPLQGRSDDQRLRARVLLRADATPASLLLLLLPSSGGGKKAPAAGSSEDKS